MAVPRDAAPDLQDQPLSGLLTPAGDARTTTAAVEPRPGLDRDSVVILLTAALCLYGARFGQDLRPDDWGRLAKLSFWAGTQILFYGVVPLTVAWAVLGRSPADLGLRVRGATAHAWTYAALFLVAVPFVLVASITAGFQERYPLLEVPIDGHVYPALALWWGWYIGQFVAIEIFFRGFLVLGLAPGSVR